MSDGVFDLTNGGPTAPVPRSWLVGFHGVVRADDLEPDCRPLLHQLALGNRSLGTQRMRELTALPEEKARPRVPPRSSEGHRRLGRIEELEFLSPPQPTPIPWDASREGLPEYLCRRLDTARFLYLPNRSRSYRIAKRVLDLVGASLLLVLALPVMVVIGVLIRRDSPGPAIFRQQRVTRGGKTFTFYKFRTMWVDARDRFPALYDYQRSGPFSDVYYKLEDDPRNTRVGRWLRRTTLDELPNLFNVLRGEMSLVGPRPELPELIAHYRPEDLALFFTKAGLTGLAQVSGRSLLTVRERITLDLRYVAQQTLVLDLRLIARTVGTVVRSRGAF